MLSLTLTALTSVLALLSMTDARGIYITVHGDARMYLQNGSGDVGLDGSSITWADPSDPVPWNMGNGANCYVDKSQGWPEDTTINFELLGGDNFLSPCGWQDFNGGSIRIVCTNPQAACT